MDQEKTGLFIAQERKQKNMTQQELADRLHVTNKAVSKWENGKSLPDGATLEPLARELGVSVDELLAGERRPEPPAERPEPVFRPNVQTVDVSQAKARAAEQTDRFWKGRVMLWVGIAVIAVQVLYLLVSRSQYIYFTNMDTLNALTAGQWEAAKDIFLFPGVMLIFSELGLIVRLTWLWGYYLSVPWAGLLFLAAVALIAAGAVKMRRARRMVT